MAIHGNTWLYMAIHGKYIEIHGNTWQIHDKYIVIDGYT